MRICCGRILAAAGRMAALPLAFWRAAVSAAVTGNAAILAAVAANAVHPLAALADPEPQTVSADYAFALDTCGSPRLIKTAAVLGEVTNGTFKAAWRPGENVTVIAPDGTAIELADGSAAGVETLHINGGGLWTIANSRAGDSEIVVRHSLYGSSGSGSAEDPLRVVDDDEIAAIPGEMLTSGFHIALCGTHGLDLSSLALGNGLSLTGLGGGVWRIDAAVDGMAANSPATTFGLDSLSSPRALKTAEDVAGLWPATRRAGETVVLVAPNGTATTLIAASSAATSASLPLDAGGLWTVGNSKQGAATFTVRHSLHGTLGDGTADSPAKLVDGDELVDYNAGNGYVFTMNGGATLLGALRLPNGFRLEKGDGEDAQLKWRIVSDVSGREFVWAELASPLDTYYAGSKRRLYKKDMTPVAYSGDHWCREVAAASALTFIAPNGDSPTFNLTGTDAFSFVFNQPGRWIVRLVMEDGTTQEVVVVASYGFAISFK